MQRSCVGESCVSVRPFGKNTETAEAKPMTEREREGHSLKAPISQPLRQYRGIASTRQKPCMSSCDPFNSTTMIHKKGVASYRQQVLVSTTEFKLELPCLDVPHLELTRRGSLTVKLTNEESTDTVPVLSPEMIWWKTSLYRAPTLTLRTMGQHTSSSCWPH